MKLKYKIQNFASYTDGTVSANERDYLNKWRHLPLALPLKLGGFYTVYGLEYKESGGVNVMIIDESGRTYPNFYPIEFFDVVDNRISKHWQTEGQKSFPLEGIKYPSLITFEAYKSDPSFFDKLVTPEGEAPRQFQEMKNKIDREFPQQSNQTAKVLEGFWVTCPVCGDSWENTSSDGVVFCPQGHENNNPFWQPS